MSPLFCPFNLKRTGLVNRFNESLKYIQRRAFYAEHQLLAVWMILIVLILPFLGLVVSGLFGVIAGAPGVLCRILLDAVCVAEGGGLRG